MKTEGWDVQVCLPAVAAGRQSVFFDDHPLKHTPQEYFLRQWAVAPDADEPSIKYVVD